MTGEIKTFTSLLKTVLQIQASAAVLRQERADPARCYRMLTMSLAGEH